MVSSDSDGLAVDPPGSAGIFRIAHDSAGIDTALLQDGDCGRLKTPLAAASGSWGDPACRFPPISMCAGGLLGLSDVGRLRPRTRWHQDS